MADAVFDDLIRRIRCGDELAAGELVRLYEPHIRRLVRIRLTDSALRRQIDSADICQSVMADFFVRVALGQFELKTPEQLVALLATMARNKLTNHAQKQQAARRNIRRLEKVDVQELPMARSRDTPSRIVAGRELLEEVRRRFTDDERYLVDQRASGKAWAEIADELGTNVDALRMRLKRALNRVAQGLNLKGSGNR